MNLKTKIIKQTGRHLISNLSWFIGGRHVTVTNDTVGSSFFTMAHLAFSMSHHAFSTSHLTFLSCISHFYLASRISYLATCIFYLTSRIFYLAFCIFYLASRIFHLASCIFVSILHFYLA